MARTKVIASIRTLALTATAVLMTISTASSADAPNPFIGNWALDTGKSTFSLPPGPKSQKVTVTEAPGGATRTVIDTVGGDGSTYHLDYTSANDGKSVPTSGDPGIDSVVATMINSNTIKDVFMKTGKAVQTGTFTVSKSGKTFQGPNHGTNADGSKWKAHLVYARQ
jgi:hypothetical protein